MLEKFLTNVNNNLLFNKEDFLLLAISGGVDSVVLADLLHTHQFNWAMAHCNFSLRSKDADEDEQFVLELSKKYSVKCFSIKFDTLQYAEKHGLSIQIAARELRYKWFNELMKTHSFNYLLTAHHLDDNIETVLLNQIRGTSIKGLAGIPLKQNNIVRPLLNFTKEEILNYAHTRNLKYREDISNTKDKYQRNFIRLNIIPLIKQLQPQLYSVFQNNIQNFNESKKFTDDMICSVINPLIMSEKDSIKISLEKLYNLPHLHFVLQHYLSQFGFNSEQIKDIAHSKKSVGKRYNSSDCVLVFDREYMIIAKHYKLRQEYIAHNLQELNLYSNKFYFEIINNDKHINLKEKKISYINADSLQFPLKLRHRKDGDRFQLLGTNYEKKLSDIFIDKKVPLLMKDKIVLLTTTNDEVLWISYLNLINEKYKVTNDTKTILKIITSE